MDAQQLALARRMQALTHPSGNDADRYSVRELPSMAFLRGLFPNGQASHLCFALMSCGPGASDSMTLEEIALEIEKPALVDPPRLNLLAIQPLLACMWHGWLPVFAGDLRFLQAVRASSHHVLAAIGLPSGKARGT